MVRGQRRQTATEVLRVFLPCVALIVAGSLASTYVVQTGGEFWLAVLLNVMPMLGALYLIHRAKTR